VKKSLDKGFTLIELLVVIAIIAILAAILFPVFAQAREKARQSTDQSNEKQIASAYLMYLQDYDETFPLPVQSPTRFYNVYFSPWNIVQGRTAPPWDGWYLTQGANVTYPYIKNYGVWQTPNGDVVEQFPGQITFVPGATPTNISYTFNGILGASVISQVRSPATCPLLWNGLGKVAFKGSGINDGVPADNTTVPWPFAYQPCGSGYYGTLFGPYQSRIQVYSGGQNWAFVDGHVKWRKLGSGDWRTDPFTYNPDGTVQYLWWDGCAPWLFRPIYEPEG